MVFIVTEYHVDFEAKRKLTAVVRTKSAKKFRKIVESIENRGHEYSVKRSVK